jgi:hypothetical protein
MVRPAGNGPAEVNMFDKITHTKKLAERTFGTPPKFSNDAPQETVKKVTHATSNLFKRK